MALLLVPAGASAASPVLEFVVPGHSFPISFITEGGAVSAQMAGFQTLVHCAASHGEGEVTGPRSTVSKYQFTGCSAEGQKCKSAGAKEEEITTGPIDGDLVYIDQAKDEVGILLNPGGGTYISFECGGESAEGKGSFLAPVSPLNTETMSFTATLTQSNSVQTPDEYEGEKGEALYVFPTGRRGTHEFVPTGVELAMTVTSSVPGEIKAITTQEVEAKQHAEEAKKLEEALQKQEGALKKQEEASKKIEAEAKKHEEALNAQITELEKHQEDEAAANKRRQEEEKGKKGKRGKKGGKSEKAKGKKGKTKGGRKHRK
jgi:hypothetical protein